MTVKIQIWYFYMLVDQSKIVISFGQRWRGQIASDRQPPLCDLMVISTYRSVTKTLFTSQLLSHVPKT